MCSKYIECLNVRVCECECVYRYIYTDMYTHIYVYVCGYTYKSMNIEYIKRVYIYSL